MISIDPVSAVLALVLFGAFTVPFIYHFQKNKQKEKQLSLKLLDVGKTAGAKPDLIETWRNQYALGLDTPKKVLLYLSEGEANNSFCIPLSEVKKVTVLIKTKEIGELKKPVVEHVGLEIYFTSPTKKSIILEIFNEEQFSDLMGETVLAEKWAESIKKLL